MFVAPQVYLPTILAGPAARAELPRVSPDRLARLARRLGGPPPQALSEGEMAAMGWVCELMGLADAARRFPDRVLWLDFEDFLGRRARAWARFCAILHGEARDADLTAMLASPDLGRYSKAPEHAYDAGLRREVIAQAGVDHRAEIERGLAWLNAAGARHAEIAAAARQAAGAPRPA